MTAERTRSLYAFVFVASLIGWLYFIWARVPSDAEEWERVPEGMATAMRKEV